MTKLTFSAVFFTLILLSSTGVGAFLLQEPPAKSAVVPSSYSNTYGLITPQSQLKTITSSSSTKLLLAKKEDEMQGIGRGLPIMALALLATIWSFSIPPEFRRAYICSDRCSLAENRARPQCNSCVTGEEWINGVKQYYRDGGGIQFDFSIDPNSQFKLWRS